LSAEVVARAIWFDAAAITSLRPRTCFAPYYFMIPAVISARAHIITFIVQPPPSHARNAKSMPLSQQASLPSLFDFQFGIGMD
jgi:hypothetical protein